MEPPVPRVPAVVKIRGLASLHLASLFLAPYPGIVRGRSLVGFGSEVASYVVIGKVVDLGAHFLVGEGRRRVGFRAFVGVNQIWYR